jgi:glycosyltransferase involved in cell wall biosynthesis
VVPNGVDERFFLKETDRKNGDLVCTATITPRKRAVELAEAAIEAGIPVRFIGRPYTEDDAYYQRFLTLSRKHLNVVQYAGAIEDRNELAAIYKGAKGFVLLSSMETLSLSSLEAAAAGCPLLLSDLPWAHAAFGALARYCSPTASTEETARILKDFAENINRQPTPPVPLTWAEVAKQFLKIYQESLRRSVSTSL